MIHKPQFSKQIIAFFRVSLISQVRTPAAIVFGFIFPLVLIAIFGFLGTSEGPTAVLGVVPSDDIAYQRLITLTEETGVLQTTQGSDQELRDQLALSEIDGVIRFDEFNRYTVTTGTTNPQQANLIRQTIVTLIDKQTLATLNAQPQYDVNFEQLDSREISYIDFALPGLLGFSLLSGSISAVAFSFLTLRKTQALKRIFAAPAFPGAFIIGQSLARLVFNFFQTAMLILVAVFGFGFTLLNGYATIIEMSVILIIGLFCFLGMGYIVAGIAKNNDQAGPLSQMVILPQILLGGTFFPVSSLPDWLQVFSRALPVYNFNTALRLITTEGLRIWSPGVIVQIIFLGLWTGAVYVVASRVFKVRDN